jgi:histone chaperone ASF1
MSIWILLTVCRDSEESAPAEYPPDQPEADQLEDDGTTYGAEEIELEEALIREEAALKAEEGEDEEMGGTDEANAAAKADEDDDDDSDEGSEDLEAESSGSEDEEGDEEEADGDGDGDEEMDMGEDNETKVAEHPVNVHHSEVMAH